MDEPDDTGPVCKRSSSKRLKRSHLAHTNISEASKDTNKQPKTDNSVIIMDTSVEGYHDDFDKFSDSDLALAEMDLTGLSPLMCLRSSSTKRTSSNTASRHKTSKHIYTRKRDSKTKPELVGKNLFDSHLSERSQQKHSVSKECDVCVDISAEIDLFNDSGDLLKEDSLDTFVNGNHDKAGTFVDNIKVSSSNEAIAINTHRGNVVDMTATETSLDDSLSEYFFIGRSHIKDINTSNVSSPKKNSCENKVTSTDQKVENIESANSKSFCQSLVASSQQDLKTPHISTSDVVRDSSITHTSAPIAQPNEVTSSEFKSLKERLKQRLQQNVGVIGHNKDPEEWIKLEAVQQAKLEASQIRKEGTEVDIGPFYGLPLKVQKLFETNRGISKLYDWQDECLKLPAIKERRNLIYTLPTSGGKTLVAEVLIMRELMCYHRDALLILPYVSIVQEKVQTISEFATELGFIVEEYAGSKGRFPPVKKQSKKSLYIATIEKGHSLINSLLETDRMGSLGLVVVDELHMIGEGGSRGAILEATLLKIITAPSETQIIGMSATLNNINELQTFLNADVYFNDFRPVTLHEYVKVEDNVFLVNQKALAEEEKLEHNRFITFQYTKELQQRDPDHLYGLVTEVIPANSCLVFCSTKKNCENVARMLSELICKHQRHLAEVNKPKRKQLLQELLQAGEGQICPVLEYTVHFGIAYHHSGLTMDERHLIEEAYSAGVLCLLTCTSTLAAGVNLPAMRVILRSPYIGKTFIKYSQYKQMTGRAGRAGIDSSGESILIANSTDRMKVRALLAGPKDYCHSSLAYDNGKGITFLLLSAIGLKLVTTTESAFDLLKKSLLYIQASGLGVDVTQMTRDSLQYLIDQGLVLQTKVLDDNTLDERYLLQVTALGKATFKGSIDHSFSRQLYEDLEKAKGSLNVDTHLHLIYLVTPYDMASTIKPDWNVYLNQFFKLSELEVKAAEIIGVPENYVGLMASGRKPRKKFSEMTMNRFYLSLILWNLWNQKSVWDVAEKFSQSRGFIQNLLTQSATFASCVFHFCQELEEFWAYQDLMTNFIKKFSYCVKMELIPLMEIPGVKIGRANQLYAAGYRNIAMIASASVDTLVKSVEHLSRRAAKQMISSAINILEEKTTALLEEVESLVTVPS
ncbi:helicase POLQ-like [Physella acuta]|uniref:helicase POLQ-like n=1 Tax=Physella acuta TaxID=109671 RepID=UPI0027DDA604|nr:helicase POLQ-like [Physella acuta]